MNSAKWKQLAKQYCLLIAAGAIIVSGLVHAFIAFERVISDRVYLHVPGTTELQLAPGDYLIFYEFEEYKRQLGPMTLTAVSKIDNIPEIVTISVMGEHEPREIGLEHDTSTTYLHHEKSGESLLRFEVPAEARYQVSVQWREAEPEEPIRLTIAPQFSRNLVSIGTTLGIYLLIALPIVAAGLVIYFRMEKRKGY